MAGKKGFGAVLSYSVDGTIGIGTTFVPIANVTKIRPYAQKADVIDVTAMDSASEFREKMAGLKDAGQCVFDLNWDDKATTHLFLTTNLGVMLTLKVTGPGGTPKTATFAAFFSNIPPEIPHDNKMTCSVTAEISGVVTIA